MVMKQKQDSVPCSNQGEGMGMRHVAQCSKWEKIHYF